MGWKREEGRGVVTDLPGLVVAGNGSHYGLSGAFGGLHVRAGARGFGVG